MVYRPQIDALIAQQPGLSAERVLAEISKGSEGYAGCIALVRRYLRQAHPARREQVKEAMSAWLFDIIASERNPKREFDAFGDIPNLDRILEVATSTLNRDSRRALAVLARTKGFSVKQVAECLHMCCKTVRDACDANTRNDSSGPFRRRKGDSALQNCQDRVRVTKALMEIVHNKPNAYGINRSNWTRQSLADAYEMEHGRKISESWVGKLFKAAGYRRQEKN